MRSNAFRELGLRPESTYFSPLKVGGLNKKRSFLTKKNKAVGALQQTKKLYIKES